MFAEVFPSVSTYVNSFQFMNVNHAWIWHCSGFTDLHFISIILENEQKIDLSFDEYGGPRLGDCNVIRFTTTAKVVETGNLYVDRYDLRLESPACMAIQVFTKPNSPIQ